MSVPLQRSLLLVVLLLILLRDLESSAEANTVASASFRFVTLLPVARADLADPAERALCEMPALHARQLSAIHHNAQAVLAYTGTPLLVVQPHVSVDEGADAESLAVRRAFAELSADLRAASDTEADEPAYPHTLLLPVRLPPSHRALACNLTHVRTHGSPSLAEQDLLLTEVLRALAQASVSELSRVNEVVLLPPGYVILHPRFFNLLRYRFVTPLAGVPLSDEMIDRIDAPWRERDDRKGRCTDFLSPLLDPQAALYVHIQHFFGYGRRQSPATPPAEQTSRGTVGLPRGNFTVLSPRTSKGHVYEPLVWHWVCPEQWNRESGATFATPTEDQSLCYAGVLRGRESDPLALSKVAWDAEIREWSRELLASRLDHPSDFVRRAWEGSTVQTMVYSFSFLSRSFAVLVSNHRQLSAARLHFLVHFALFSGEELSVATSRQLSELRAQGVKVRVQRMNAESCVGVVNPLHCQKKLFYNQLLASRSKLEHPTDDAADDSVIFVDADYLVLSGHLFARALLVAQGTEFLATASHVHLRCIFPKVDWNSGFFVMQRSVLSAQAIDDIQQAILKSQSGDQRGLSKYIRTHPGVMREFTSYQWHCRAYADLSSDVQTHLLQSGYCKGVHGDFKRPPSVDQGLRLLNNSVSSFAEYHVAYN
mmetsp:Transcript_15160/g.38481  ORF Transcript_15160/g.38481 Transcript_15160/m.38481 type:complete len:654 (-) Transcript_15160:309-2270(-)